MNQPPTQRPVATSRTHRARLLAVPAVVAALAAPLAAAPAALADEGADPYLRVATSSDIDSLNPFLAVLASSTNLIGLTYERLVEWSAEDNSEVPGMASEWTTSPDGLTWEYTIPEGRVWSDGEPVTAEDAAWTFTAIIENEPLQQANGGLVTNIESAVAVDDDTLEIRLKAPQAPNPGADLPIVPAHIWSELDAPEEFANDEDVVGSGPFLISSFEEGQSVELVANESFWRGEPQIAGIRYVYYKNGDAQVQGLRAGEVDLVSGLTPAQYEALEGAEGIALNAGDGRRYNALALNPGAKDATGAPLGDGHPVLQDVAVRRAIAMAIDKDAIVERVKQGYAVVGETEIPPVYPAYFGIDDDQRIEFDPEAANALLDEAGYELGPDGVRLDKQGEPIELRIMGRSSNPAHAQTAEYIQPWLEEIGIATRVDMFSDNQVNDDSTLGRYDMYFTGWGIGPDPDFQLSINTCSSFPNADGSGALSESNWCSPEFDELFTAQHTELDPERRAELVREAWAVKYADAVNLVLTYDQALEAYRSDRFTDFTTQPADGGIITNQNGYWAFYEAAPVASAESVASSDGAPTWLVVGIIAGVVVVGGVILLILRRRNAATADDRA